MKDVTITECSIPGKVKVHYKGKAVYLEKELVEALTGAPTETYWSLSSTTPIKAGTLFKLPDRLGGGVVEIDSQYVRDKFDEKFIAKYIASELPYTVGDIEMPLLNMPSLGWYALVIAAGTEAISISDWLERFRAAVQAMVDVSAEYWLTESEREAVMALTMDTVDTAVYSMIID